MFQKPYFYFLHGEITSTASQLTSPASQKSKDLNKVLLLLQDLGLRTGSSLNQIVKLCYFHEILESVGILALVHSDPEWVSKKNK